jgi:tRNA G18 (ribose-2'-O)-methylase SpoU
VKLPMVRELITDLDDPRIAAYRSLKATNQTRNLDQFVVEGAKLVDRLLASRFPVVSILATDRYVDRLADKLSPEVPLYVVPFERIHSIVGFPFHRGVVACGKRIPWPAPVSFLRQLGPTSTTVICPRISNPENLGAIARISDVFGVAAILAGHRCPDPLARRVLRVSMGSVLHIPVVVSDHLEELVDRLADELGVELWAAVADHSGRPFDQVSRPHRLALVLGDEDQGVDADWLRRCRQAITIPMRPGAGSLNVAVAAGILLHHLTRPASAT